MFLLIFSEYPIAAGTPESGTGTIKSDLIWVSFANSAPNLFLYSYTLTPLIILSGLEKYIYSKIHGLTFI